MNAIFNYFPFRQFLWSSKSRYQGQKLEKCVHKVPFMNPQVPLHVGVGKGLFLRIGNFLAWLQAIARLLGWNAIFWKIASFSWRLKAKKGFCSSWPTEVFGKLFGLCTLGSLNFDVSHNHKKIVVYLFWEPLKYPYRGGGRYKKIVISIARHSWAEMLSFCMQLGFLKN